MTALLRVACVQNCAGADRDANLDDVEALVRDAAGAGARLVALPEHFSQLLPDDAARQAALLPEAGHPALVRMQALARSLGVWLLLGSIAVAGRTGRARNRCYLVADDGSVVASYDKLHLFDVDLPGGERHLESDGVEPGEAPVLARTPWGGLGLTICYDVRFPELYQALARAGAAMLAVPAAFTVATGRAHWEVLVRARAIETQCHVLAPAQFGTRSWGRATWGHSLIVDPWGTVLADAGEDRGVVVADLDLGRQREIRTRLPVLDHHRALAPVQVQPQD